MLSDPTRHVIVKTLEFKRALGAFRGSSLPNRHLCGEDYSSIQTFLFDLRDQMEAAGLSPRDLIDVQTLIWVGDPTYGQSNEEQEIESGDDNLESSKADSQ
jgi:hypothetical protein